MPEKLNSCSSHKDPHCQSCAKSSNNLFSDLPDAALSILDNSKMTRKFKKGEPLFHAGDDPKGIYCVNSGTIKLETEGPQGNGHILRVVQGGGMIGYRSLFANEAYHATAVGVEEGTACYIPRSSFLQVIEKFPDLSLKLLNHISKELGSAENRLIKMTDQSASERIAESLLFLRENFDAQNWTRKEIAEWAGTTPETVMRTLAQFEVDGLIAQVGRKIEIKNRKALVELANLDL